MHNRKASGLLNPLAPVDLTRFAAISVNTLSDYNPYDRPGMTERWPVAGFVV